MTASSSSGGRPARFLFAMFQGGGNIPLILPIAAQLIVRGHAVRVLARRGIRAGRLPVSARRAMKMGGRGRLALELRDAVAQRLEEGGGEQHGGAQRALGGWQQHEDLTHRKAIQHGLPALAQGEQVAGDEGDVVEGNGGTGMGGHAMIPALSESVLISSSAP